MFEEQKRRILEVIGDMVASIHHIGSTSIVGLLR
ncbi:GrpB family protein (plasmid) [Mesorhizobium sp. AR07]|nr:GrpB family protein [Mesorhizobium sp. AR07]UVK48299.1 GrpB family protein [Mesorhizobium sp. AR07]